MNKLRLTPAATITPNENGIVLQSDLGAFQLHGKDIRDFIDTVMPLLDGRYAEAEICEQLTTYDDNSIQQVLNLLQNKGLIETVNTDAKPPWPVHERFFKAWNGATASNKLTQSRVLVLGAESWVATMVEQLAMSGVSQIQIIDNTQVDHDDCLCYHGFDIEHIGLSRAKILTDNIAKKAPWCNFTHAELAVENGQLSIAGQEWDLIIVGFAPEATYWLTAASHYIEATGITALYGHLDGLEAVIGPVVVPNETACWHCLKLRRLGTSDNPQLAHVLESDSTTPQQRARTLLAPMAALAGQQLAMEAIKLLSAYTTTSLKNAIQVSHLVSGESETHEYVAMPWCEVCGGAHGLIQQATQKTQSQQASAVALSAVASVSPTYNPLNRIANVEQFKALLKAWINPVTGVVRQLTGHLPTLPDFPITASAGLSCFTAGEFDPRAMGQVGSGKGLDEVSAHISAFGEAIERYSAARYRLEDLKYAKMGDLSGDKIDPDTLVLYSKRQYQTPQFPFSPWQRKQKIHWTKGTWLGTDKPVWVPALISYFNFKSVYEEQFSQVSSNGLAAGQSNEDAGIRACYELIERDAMMLTWYAQQPCQRVKLDALYEGKFKVLIDEITAKNISLELYLLDVGVHVPTIVCLALGDGYSSPAVSVSLATHGDIMVAMRKAVLEQGHVMPYLCYLMTSGQKWPMTVEEVQSLEDHAAYYFNLDKRAAFDFMRQPESNAISPSDWKYPIVSDAKDLNYRLQRIGVDVAIVDVTSPDVALSSPFRVARAVGVHMQPIHFGEQFKRVNNPRLRRLLKGQPVNMNPHPIA